MFKKLLSFLLIGALALSGSPVFADSKVTELTETTSLAGSDLLYSVINPGSTPASRKITLQNAINSGFSLRTTSNLSEGSNLYWTATRGYNKIKSTLQAGTNITLTPNDGAETITIAASGGGGGGSVDGNTRPGFVTGLWYGGYGWGTQGTLAVTANTMYAVPFSFGDTNAFDQIGLNIGTAGGTNCTIYTYANNNGYPGTLLDSAQIATGTTGDKTAAITRTLTADSTNHGWAWVGVFCDGTPSVRSYAVASRGILGSTSLSVSSPYMITVSQTYAATPPSSFPAGGTFSGSGNLPLVMLRKQ